MTNNFAADFMRGQIDCKAGRPHRFGQSEAYDRGYSAEYELSAINDALTVDQFNERKER